MWASLKNYAINPMGGGTADQGASTKNELPFNTKFTKYDRQELLYRSSQRQQCVAARRKLILALTEDTDCFHLLQKQLRQRHVSTHVLIGELLKTDTQLLDELSKKVMKKGVLLSKESQLEHHIISKSTAANHHVDYHHKDVGGNSSSAASAAARGSSSLLHNLKGLIIQQDSDSEEDEESDDDQQRRSRNAPVRGRIPSEYSEPRLDVYSGSSGTTSSTAVLPTSLRRSVTSPQRRSTSSSTGSHSKARPSKTKYVVVSSPRTMPSEATNTAPKSSSPPPLPNATQRSSSLSVPTTARDSISSAVDWLQGGFSSHPDNNNAASSNNHISFNGEPMFLAAAGPTRGSSSSNVAISTANGTSKSAFRRSLPMLGGGGGGGMNLKQHQNQTTPYSLDQLQLLPPQHQQLLVKPLGVGSTSNSATSNGNKLGSKFKNLQRKRGGGSISPQPEPISQQVNLSSHQLSEMLAESLKELKDQQQQQQQTRRGSSKSKNKGHHRKNSSNKEQPTNKTGSTSKFTPSSLLDFSNYYYYATNTSSASSSTSTSDEAAAIAASTTASPDDNKNDTTSSDQQRAVVKAALMRTKALLDKSSQKQSIPYGHKPSMVLEESEDDADDEAKDEFLSNHSHSLDTFLTKNNQNTSKRNSHNSINDSDDDDDNQSALLVGFPSAFDSSNASISKAFTRATSNGSSSNARSLSGGSNSNHSSGASLSSRVAKSA